MKKMPLLVSMFLVVFAITNGYAQTKDPISTTLTIYQQNLGVVHQQYEMNIARGQSQISISDIPQSLIPSSVKLDIDGSVLEQNFVNHVTNLGEVLKKNFIGKNIRLISKTGQVIEGTLASIDGSHVIIKRQQGDFMIVPDLLSYNISVEPFPLKSAKYPQLNWVIDSQKKGNQKVGLTYQTHGLNWKAEYTAVLDGKEEQMDLNAWANLSNSTGYEYKNSHIKLVAGDLNLNSGGAIHESMYARAKSDIAVQAPNAMSQRTFSDYHVYDLDRVVDLGINAKKQIRLFKEKTFPIKKEYVFNDRMMGGAGKGKIAINVRLTFENSKSNGLGIPLPSGTFNIYKKDGNNLVLLGQDAISSTPENEKVTLNVGRAFDVEGTQKLAEVRKISDRMNEQDFEITLRNHKDTPIVVTVNRYLNNNSTIIKTSQRYEKVSANLVRFMVSVPKDGSAKLTYTIRNQY